MQKKYLVVLAGSPRGGEKTWNSLFKYVVDHLHADLAVSTTDDYLSENILFKKSNYQWIMPNPVNFDNYFEKYFSGNWRDYLLLGKELGLYHSGIISFAFKDYIFRNYKNILMDYEYIIYTRFDQFYTDYHPDFYSDKIFIPSGEDYFGICDRHAVFRSSRAEQFFSIANYIDSQKSLQKLPKFLNCESVFKAHLQHEELFDLVERFDRVSFTSSTENDETKWRKPELKIFFTKGLMIKYPDEFLEALKNKLSKKNFSTIFLREPVLNLYYFYILTRKIFGRLLKQKNNSICDIHGEYFMSERYAKLKVCPECSDI